MTDPNPITAARQRLGKSQDELGAFVGVDGMTVSRWERGESLPQRRFWPKLEEICERPIAEILAAAHKRSEVAA